MSYRFIGIDPGTNALGVSVFTDLGGKINLEESFTLIIGKNVIHDPRIEDRYGYKFARLNAFATALLNVFERCRPDHVACESPFYNRFRPNAFAPLVEMLYVILDTVSKLEGGITFSRHDPSTVKKTVGTKGNSGEKNDMTKNVKVMLEREGIMKDWVNTLDEHAIDSIAVGYTWWKDRKSVV